jgi:plastocyanin
MTTHKGTHPLALLAVLVMLALGGLAVAGCGGDDDDGDDGATETEAATDEGGGETAAGGSYGGGGGANGDDADGGDDADAGGGGATVAVSLTDFAIDPANPTVEAGTVTFDVSNDGQAPHNLEVEGQGVEEELPEDLGAGESGQLTVELSEPGTYEWYCPVGEHADMGMEGELTVQ